MAKWGRTLMSGKAAKSDLADCSDTIARQLTGYHGQRLDNRKDVQMLAPAMA